MRELNYESLIEDYILALIHKKRQNLETSWNSYWIHNIYQMMNVKNYWQKQKTGGIVGIKW